MKKKIISFIGLLLFVGVVAFNVQMVNSNNQDNTLVLENIEALADSSNPCDSCDGDCCANWFCHACCEGGGTPNCTLTACQCL